MIQSALIYLSFATFLLNRTELHIPVVIRATVFFLNGSHMTLRQKSWYVTQNLLINAPFIIPWPPGCSSQGGFDPFLRLKKIKSASHLNTSVQNLSCTLYIGDILQLPGLFASSGLSDEVRFARNEVNCYNSSLANFEVSNIDSMKAGWHFHGGWLPSSLQCFASRLKKLAVSIHGISLHVTYNNFLVVWTQQQAFCGQVSAKTCLCNLLLKYALTFAELYCYILVMLLGYVELYAWAFLPP